MLVILTTHGHRLIISTWVITPTPGMVSATVMVVMAAGFPLASAMVIRRGITLPAIMVTTRHGMPRIITTLIILPGGIMVAIVHTVIGVVTTTIMITGGMGTTVMPIMTNMIAVTVMMKEKMLIKIAGTGEAKRVTTAHHVLVDMYPLHLPDIPVARAW